MKLWADVNVTDKESYACAAADALGAELHILEHNNKRFYVVFDDQETPAVYDSLEAAIADNYGQETMDDKAGNHHH